MAPQCVEAIEQVAPFAGAIAAVLIIFAVLVFATVKVLIYCLIFRKAGYSWALGLLMLVPVANIIMPFVLAFGDWPICKEIRALKQGVVPQVT